MRYLAILALVGLGACGGDRDGLVEAPVPQPTISPTPDPRTAAVPGASTGPTAITLLAADPPPGATLSGCGPQLGGCPERVRMRFRLASPSAGTVLWVVGFLHGSNRLACLSGRVDGFTLGADTPREVEIEFDTPDLNACAPPVTISHLAVVVEGTADVASRQEWAVVYEFAP